MLSFCAFLSGAEDFEEVEDYGNEKLSFLSAFLQLDNGITGQDTINRVFEGISPTQFSSCMYSHSLLYPTFFKERRFNG